MELSTYTAIKNYELNWGSPYTIKRDEIFFFNLCYAFVEKKSSTL